MQAAADNRGSGAGDSALRVLFAVQQGALSPGSRYRVLQYLPHFERAGLSCKVLEMQSARSTRRSIHSAQAGLAGQLFHACQQLMESQLLAFQLLRRATQFDRLYLYRVPLPVWAADALRRHRARILFDIDDAWDAPEGDGTALARLRRRFLAASLERAISVASVVVVSNQRNADVVRRLGGHAEVVPTTIDLAQTLFRDRASAPARSRPVLGWIGTPSTARYLPLIELALVRETARRSIVVRLIGSGGNPFRSLVPEVREWAAASEAEEIAAFDIGLMPMPDTPWTRGKAALKALQYGASGAPTVASWTETNEAILGSGEGTVFCRTEDDWVREIDALVCDPARRGELGKRGRRRVEERYSVERCAPRLVSLILGGQAAACAQERLPEAST